MSLRLFLTKTIQSNGNHSFVKVLSSLKKACLKQIKITDKNPCKTTSKRVQLSEVKRMFFMNLWRYALK